MQDMHAKHLRVCLPKVQCLGLRTVHSVHVLIAWRIVVFDDSEEALMISSCRQLHAMLALLVLACSALGAQSDSSSLPPVTGKPNLTALAKESQNPIGSLAQGAIQSRFGWNTGPDDRFHAEVNILPVIPTALSDNILLVPQLTLPLVYQSVTLTAVRDGLGDAMLQLYLAPRNPDVVSIGVGPAVVAPTATSKGTGTGKWSAGPTAALVANPGPWVIGAVATQVWSFAGQSNRAPVSFLEIQPFVNYNMPGGWSIISRPIMTADFEAPSSEQWLVPVGAGLAKTFSFGVFPMSFGVAGYANVVRPTTASSFELRLTYALLVPR